MTESMYALAALLAIITLSVNQQENIHAARLNRIRGEIFLLSAGIANERLDLMATIPFDSLDAYSGEMEDAVPFDSDTLTFTIYTEIGYMGTTGGQFNGSISPTQYKEVKIRVEGELDTAVEINRIYQKSVK